MLRAVNLLALSRYTAIPSHMSALALPADTEFLHLL